MPASASDNLKADFAERLREAREKAGFTQPQLAKACGWVTQSRISMYENGKRWPALDHVIKLAAALNVSAQWLVFGDDKDKPKRGKRFEQQGFLEKHLAVLRKLIRLPDDMQDAIIDVIANAYAMANGAKVARSTKEPAPT